MAMKNSVESNVQVKCSTLLEQVEMLETQALILSVKQADLIRRQDEIFKEQKRVALDEMLEQQQKYREMIEHVNMLEKQSCGEIKFSLLSYLRYWHVLLVQHVLFVAFE
jgi:hypothetical protein